MKNKEKVYKPISGYMMLLIVLAVIAGSAAAASVEDMRWMIIVGGIITVLILPGFFVVNPNGSKVLVFFGAYQGTVKRNGFFWVNDRTS